MDLSPEEKDRIEAEEIVRQEVIKRADAPKTLSDKLLKFLNSGLGLWLLSAVFVSGFSTIYSMVRDAHVAETRQLEASRKLTLEVSHRKEIGVSNCLDCQAC